MLDWNTTGGREAKLTITSTFWQKERGLSGGSKNPCKIETMDFPHLELREQGEDSEREKVFCRKDPLPLP